MAPGRWCHIARAGIEIAGNAIAAISDHLSPIYGFAGLPSKVAVIYVESLILSMLDKYIEKKLRMVFKKANFP